MEIKVNVGDIVVLPNKQTISLESVTAEKAKMLLETSIGNRKLNVASIAQMKQDLVDGKWCSTTKPIYIDENGSLMEGHHRLTAIAGSGISTEMLVVRGFPRSMWDKLNRDKNWMASAYASANNIPYSVLAMAAIRVRECLRRGLRLGSIVSGLPADGRIWNNEDFVNLYNAEFGAWETDVASAARWSGIWDGLPGSIAAGSLHHLVYDQHYDRTFVTNFFSQLYTLENITATVRTLRNRLDRERIERRQKKLKTNQNLLCLLVASAFDGYVHNTPKTKLQIPNSNAVPCF